MSKTKILIVDDDMAASRLLGLGLEKTGVFEVKVENCATHAFGQARAFHPIVRHRAQPSRRRREGCRAGAPKGEGGPVSTASARQA